jgi:hypothetical protein
MTPDQAEALLRAATYLKWWRDGAITPNDVEPPEDINDIIRTLEELAYEAPADPVNQPPRAGRLVVEQTQEVDEAR